MQRFALAKAMAFRRSTPQLSAAAVKTPGFEPYCKMATDFVSRMNGERAFVASSIILGSCLPLAIFFAPSFLSVPFDLAVSVALPYHMWHGTKNVVSDYAPKAYRVQAIQGWAVLAAISGIGLVKLGICGPGVGASIKSLWAPAKVQKKVAKKDMRRD